MTAGSIKVLVAAPLWAMMLVAGAAAAFAQGGPPAGAQNGSPRSRSRVIVELRLPGGHVPEADLPDGAAVVAQRQAIQAGAEGVTAALPAGSRIVRRYATVPYVVLEATAEARADLAARSGVARVLDDLMLFPVLAERVPLVEADQAWAGGYDGSGTMVAVLDTGIDASHPLLAGKVVEEACFSTTEPGISQTLCPNGLDEQFGAGAAAPCAFDDCLHGTHVAGIAAGRDLTSVPHVSGVARGASLFAIQVFTRVVDPETCSGAVVPCVGAFTSDVIAALERVYAIALAGEHRIAAVNLSLGGELFTAPCDAEPYKPIIDNLRTIGVATVVAAGNSGLPVAIATPACISSAISVGSTDLDDNVSWFSNAASFLSLLAPGESVVSSVPGGGYAAFSGTSMAAPFVSGAWSLLRQAAPAADVDTILAALRETGVPVRDARFFFGSATVPRIRIFRALATLAPTTNPAPSIASTDPTHARAGGGGLTLTVTGDGFNTFSAVRWNGAAMQTRVLSTTTLQATIPAAALATEGTALVSVFSPGPGGGTSGAVAFTIEPPPAISVDSAVVAPGSTVTALLVRGFGGPVDYLTLADAAAPDSSYLSWTYVGSGVTERAWTVSLPMAAGRYEVRLYVDGVRAATSPSVLVDAALSPVPIATGLSPAFAVAGTASLTVTVTGSRFTASSVVMWNGAHRPTTAVSATQLRAVIAASDIATPGSAQIAVFTPAPGGGTSSGLGFTVRAAPTISVTSATARGGQSVTATLTGGVGGSGDWLALAPSPAPNGTYLAYVLVGAGVTDRAWTTTLPMTPGSYEFRLFSTSGARLATSPVVTVEGPTLSVGGASVAAGAPITVTLSGGSGGAGDWLAFAAAGAPDTGYLKYTFVGAGVTTRTWTVTAPSTPGAYEFRMYANHRYVRIATSAVVTVAAAAVSLTSVSPANAAAGGGGFTLTVNGSGFDPTAVVRWNGADRTTTFVSGSQLRAAIAAVDIAPAGTAQITVSGAGGVSVALAFAVVPAPVLTPGSTAIAAGTPVAVTLAGGSGSSGDWLAVAPVGAPDSTYLQYTYVGAGVTTRTWTVVLPAPGTFEFRLFRNGYTRVATSLPVVVSDAVPALLAVSATEAARGEPVTVTLTNGRGGATDWLAFAASSAQSGTYLQWVYVGAGVTTRTWTITMPNLPGTYEFRLFLSNGYTKLATSPTVTVR